MRMIYGTVAQASTAPADGREMAEAERRAVTRMMAALGDCPWESDALRSLPGARGWCTLAVQAAGEGGATHDTHTLLPNLAGLTIAADARLDNRAELCAALAIGPDERAALDDAGLLLRAYRQWGTDCPEHLLGDFAFALWDEAAGQLFCARDIVGVRPFYYHHAPSTGHFVCAGGLPAMVAHPAVSGSLDLAYVRAYLQYPVGQFEHPEHTFYQEIHKLPPAHCLTVTREELRRWAYWRPGRTAQRRYGCERDYVEELRALLDAAVACRIESPYPIGAHVSGGLDSSSLAVLAHRMLRTRGRGITGFSWAPPPPDGPAELPPNDERLVVEAVRTAEGFPVRYTTLTPDHALAHARRDITVQPTTTLLSELAASQDAAGLGIRTILSGWGGDELVAFNGRGYFADLLRRGRWITLQRELALRSRLLGVAAWKQWIGSGLMPLLPLAVRRHLQPGDAFRPRPLPASLRPDFAAALAGVEPLDRPGAHERPGVRNTQIALLQHGHLSYRMESWASHGAMLGITYVFPLLDRRVVEFALSIPGWLFFKDGRRRYLYRTAMAGILPDTVRWIDVKEDPVRFQADWLARENATGRVRAALLARAANPRVDVTQLASELAASELAHGGSWMANSGDSGGSEERHRQIRQRTLTDRATCLAFAVSGVSNRPPEVPSHGDTATDGRSRDEQSRH
jgi:asparagine synthase (glutamine-hydrolysing)